jgi:transposase InsO family protein
VDTIGELPESKGYNAILVVVDHLSKRIHAMPTVTTIDSAGMAQLFLEHVWRHHSLPEEILSDQGTAFVSKFSSKLAALLGIKLTPSTPYHPQTDGQTERVNQEIEAYLHVFVNHWQDDWADWLPLAKFAYNNQVPLSHAPDPI